MENKKVRHKNLSEAEKSEIAELYKNESLPLTEIASRYGISKATVCVIARATGLSRKEFYTDEEVELILQGKELGYDVVASKITEGGHPTNADTVKTLYYFYQKKQNDN